MEEIETGSVDTESGASEGSSSEASSQESASGQVAQAASSEPKQSEATPFHEHPRFKELVEQKNEAQRQYQEMISRSKAMEDQLKSLRDMQPKAPTETDELLADLKKVDPRLAKVIEAQLKSSETAKALQERLDAFENQSKESAVEQIRKNAVSKINALHDSNKMSDFGKQFINNQLDIQVRTGELKASDLSLVEAAYKKSADAIKAYEENLKRTLTQSYVQSKTKDSAVPTSVPKGNPAKPAQKALNVPKDKEALKSAIVKSFMKEQAATRDATNT